MLLFTLIRSDHLKHLTHTNFQQVALLRTLVPCVIFVFLPLCITLLGVIIWKSQRIQTPKTGTLVFFTLYFTLVGEIESFGNLSAYKLPKHAPLSTRYQNTILLYLRHPNKVISLSQIKRVWTTTITNLQKQSEVSYDGIFSFLRVSA